MKIDVPGEWVDLMAAVVVVEVVKVDDCGVAKAAAKGWQVSSGIEAVEMAPLS